ncbi:DUF3311 domain-containing protein [Streptomyces sp. LP05-1]|uniref:DUF3311 domain-containing protein n=1 Tax=Streptomyces pyxinae TaxID=2970734 RepID=A0ABT2CBZ6_9ACTN|nr:DUF3311 domain-containing protein [Streptomyces sp. LP05-1]MCS0634637.1 DUF3311 domain-containing protein [Streptomyces sp. LP05-1]
MIRQRSRLWWLLVPFVLFAGALPLVNRVEPVIGGVPFLFLWLFGATVVTPVAVGLAHRGRRAGGRPGGKR